MDTAEPKNAATEWMRASVRFLNAHESPPGELRSGLADDFVYEDRRSGPTFPNADTETYSRFVRSSWETGAGRPRRVLGEILAVRGERFAAGMYHLDYGNGMGRDSINVFGLDATLRLLQKVIDFDVDDVDAAIAELDRLHRQADAT